MTEDRRTHTAKGRRQIINKHLWRDHKERAEKETLDERYERHAEMHRRGDADHVHRNPMDLSEDYGHYVDATPLRVRTDRPPKSWTLTHHLALEHNERIVGDDFDKLAFHAGLHESQEGEWAGEPLHRHPDLTEPEETEYL